MIFLALASRCSSPRLACARCQLGVDYDDAQLVLSTMKESGTRIAIDPMSGRTKTVSCRGARRVILEGRVPGRGCPSPRSPGFPPCPVVLSYLSLPL